MSSPTDGFPVVPAWSTIRDDVRGLSHFDEMTVGIFQVATDLGFVVLRLGQELGATRAPFTVNRLHIGDTNVYAAGEDVRALRRCGDDVRLIVCRTPAGIEDQPTIAQAQHNGITHTDDRGPQDGAVELSRTILVIQ